MVEKCFKKEIKLCSKKYCTGCSACFNICPTHSISMIEDRWGEILPVINKDSCIGCGKCLTVCPYNNNDFFLKPFTCYAVWRKNEKYRKNSSSGGVAAVLAEACIQKGGIVYGVKYEQNKGVFFNRASTMEEVNDFKGSKYVQAIIGNVFQKVCEDLLEGYTVLFVGAPCQIAGLEMYVRYSTCCKYRKNLITVDFLCHGIVPQKYMFEEIKHLEKKYKIHVEQIIFRSNIPNRNYHLTLLQNDIEVYNVKAEKQRYFYCFLHSVTCRESCLYCQYKQKKRLGDITIGDFIGIGKINPVKLPTGVNPSVVLINSKRGEQLFSEVADECIAIERDFQEAVDGGPSFRGGSLISNQREVFKKYYPEYGFVKAADKAIKKEMLINNGLDLLRKYKRKLYQIKRLFR